MPGVHRWRVEPIDEPSGTQTNRCGYSGIGEQVNNGGPQDVRLEVLAEHSTEGRYAVLALTGKVANE